MGESRRNMNSEQFRGQLPQAVLGADIKIQMEPNAEMAKQIEEMKAAGIEGPVKLREQDQDVVFYLCSTWGVPLATIRDTQTSTIPVVRLGNMPLIEFKKRHKANFEKAELTAAAATISIPPESPILDT